MLVILHILPPATINASCILTIFDIRTIEEKNHAKVLSLNLNQYINMSIDENS
jgi:hypothetical protein